MFCVGVGGGVSFKRGDASWMSIGYREVITLCTPSHMLMQWCASSANKRPILHP